MSNTAGWNKSSGTLREGPIDEDFFWMLFNYVFSDSSAKRTTYKFGLLKSILDNLFNTEENEYSLFISYDNLFAKFAENYWNLVTKYHLKQMFPDGKSVFSKIEQTFMKLIAIEPSLENLPFSSIEEKKKTEICKQISIDCRKNVLGALHKDFQSCLYAFDLRGDGIFLNPYAFDFMLKYKVELEKLNYYAWAKLLEKMNDESIVVNLLEKLELATPQRDDLTVFRHVLYKEFEQNTCFYCGKKLYEIHVDHFIPWSFVKEDKLWNFVLACPSCNIRKSNKIANMDYVKQIQHRNDDLKHLQSDFVQNEFKTYKPTLISDMWKYAQSGGFLIM